MRRSGRLITAAALAGIAALHAGWGKGSSFPLSTRDDLADAVIGAREVPPPAACFVVTGLLATASGVVAGVPMPLLGRAGATERPLRRLAHVVITAVLALRGVLGVAGRTGLVSPQSTSERFRRLDRRYYGPLCLLLALGSRSARG